MPCDIVRRQVLAPVEISGVEL